MTAVVCMRTYRIEQDQTICANQVDTTTTGFTTQQEDRFFPFWVVEAVDKLLSLVDVHRAIQSKTPVSVKRGVSLCDMIVYPISSVLLLVATESLEQIQCLSVIADKDDLVVRMSVNVIQKPKTERGGVSRRSRHCNSHDLPFEHNELARQGAVDVSTGSAFTVLEVSGQHLFASREIIW